MKQLNYVIVGLGQTGLSCVRHLAAKDIQLTVADSRDNPPGLLALHQEYPDVSVCLGGFLDGAFEQADVLVVSPGVSLEEPVIARALQRGAKLVSDIDLFALAAKAPIIAVTGSNGKSTVVTLMGQVLNDAGKKAIVCGNIGLPVLEALQAPVPDYYVVELSSFQLAMSQHLKSKVGVLLNISPDHLDRHHDFADYLAAKQRIYRHCEYSVVNVDEPETWRNLSFDCQPITFSVAAGQSSDWRVIEEHDGVFLAHHDHVICCVDELSLTGRHNWQNMLVVLAMGEVLDVPVSSMLQTMRSFEGLAHRCQLVKTTDGVRWYNDSKATNVGAAVAAITSLGVDAKQHCILIVGGDSKGVALDDLRQPVSAHISHVITLGQDAEKLACVLQGCAEIISVHTISEAVARAASLTSAGDVVLLSPACASWDQYANYMERGSDFIKAVEAESACLN